MPVYIDPTVAGGGSGTYGDPFKSWSSVTWSADNLFLQKEGTTFAGKVTVGASGSPGAPKVMGTYVAATGAEKLTRVDQARIAPPSDLDAVFSDTKDYLTCRNLNLVCGGGFPSAGFRAVSGSFITVEGCDLSARVGGGPASYGIRLDNATGSAAARQGWTIRRNRITGTTGNAGVLCIWGANSGEVATDIIIEGNEINGIAYVSGSSAHGIQIQGRVTDYYLNIAGTTGKGVIVRGNKVNNVAGYGLYTGGITAGGSWPNRIVDNEFVGIGDGQFDVHVLGLQCVRDALVENNVVGNSFAYQFGSTGTGVGIFVDSPTADSRNGCERIKVLRNRVFKTGQGAGDGVEVGGAGIFVLASREIDVRYNEIIDGKNGIVVMGGFPLDHVTQTVNVTNNTILRCERNGIMTVGDSDIVTVRNNHVRDCNRGIYIQTSVDPVLNYVETNNAVFNCGLAYTEGDGPPGTTETSRTPGGTNTSTDTMATTDGYPLPGSPLLTGGFDLGFVRDLEGKQDRKFIGAYGAARLRNALGA